MTFQINTLRLDSTHPDTYNLVGFSRCLHLWWIPLLPPSYVLQVLQWINPPHTRLALNEFRASCYSHHKSQSALSETNWPLRVSGCSPYLESLPSYINGAPPWTPTNMGHEITSWPLKHDPEISPRDSKKLRTNTDQSYPNNQRKFIMHIHILRQPLLPFPFMFQIKYIPTHHTPSMDTEFSTHLIVMPLS